MSKFKGGDATEIQIRGKLYKFSEPTNPCLYFDSPDIELAELKRDIEIADSIGFDITSKLKMIRDARKSGKIIATTNDGKEHVIT